MALIKAEAAQGFTALPALRQLGLMVGLAASVAVGVAVVLWAQTPSYSLLYGSLSDKDTSEVLQALDQAKIPYKVEQSNGAVMVPSDHVHKARLKLASAGLPKGSAVGFELLQKEQELGTSQFIEQARYQHALEVELARSLTTMRNVRSARVHLAIPKRSVFIREQQEPTASVILDLYSGRSLEKAQVASVVHLVASSIPNLKPAQVTVVDQSGLLLSKQGDDGPFGLSSQQFDYTRRVEEAYRKRIEDLLTPIVGPGRVRAQVTASLDFTVSERTRESYDPQGSVLRSEQVVTEKDGAGAQGAVGVPGALSNEPPGVSPVNRDEDADSAEGEAPAPTGSSRERAVRNYEVDKTVSHTRAPSGKIERLSVAVVVDDRRVGAEGASVERSPLPNEELARITELVRDAIGFNAERGDTVHVMNSAFYAPEQPEPLPEPPLWEQGWVKDLGRQALGAVAVLLLVFGVLRPVLKSLAEKGSRLPAAAAAAQGAAGGAEQASLTGPQGHHQLPPPAASAYEDKLNRAKTMANQDPGRVAQVVRNWVASEN